AAVEPSAMGALRRIGTRYSLVFYLGAIAASAGIFAAALAANAHAAGVNRELLALVVALSLLAGSQFVVTMVNWLATLLTTPYSLPRMDYSKGIAADARTLVVVPTMLTNVRNIEDLVEALEVRFLANRDRHLHFGLLTDFPDAHEESLPADEALLRLAEARINELNRKYGSGQHQSATANGNAGDGDVGHSTHASVFYLFHRPRRWNAKARIWMGHERKRGKLGDLNSLLRGGHPDGFSLVVGATGILSQVKFVITLDTDTHLPRDAARQLVGTLAHTLN